PVAEALRTGWPMFIGSRERALADFTDPAFHAAAAAGDEHAWAVLPLSDDGVSIGTVRLAHAAEREFDSDACRFLRAVAEQVSLAFARARMFERERTAAVSLDRKSTRLNS